MGFGAGMMLAGTDGGTYETPYSAGRAAVHRHLFGRHACRRTPLLFGLPFLLVWNLFWMAATAGILAIIYYLDSRDEAARASERTGDGQ